MGKLLFAPKNETEIWDSLPYVDAYVFGIENMSVNFETNQSLNDLKPMILKLVNENKEVFISLNKNMHDHDLPRLKEILSDLETLPITGILYYDISLVTCKKENLTTHALVWNQEHFVTNYDTCNFWYEEGVSMAVLSGEITLDEMLEIKNNTDMKLIVPIFGYQPMFVSKRNLVKNYLERFSFSHDATNYVIEKEGYQYPIINNERGTEVYSSHILNGMEEMLVLDKYKMDYYFISSFHIKTDDMLKILSYYKEATDENVKDLEQSVDQLLEGNTDKGFFYKETVFRVKRNDK